MKTLKRLVFGLLVVFVSACENKNNAPNNHPGGGSGDGPKQGSQPAPDSDATGKRETDNSSKR